MTNELHKALQVIAPHVAEGGQIFILDQGHYHKFRVVGGNVSHIGSHSNSHVEGGRGCLTDCKVENTLIFA